MNKVDKKIDFKYIQNLFDYGFNYGKGWKSYYFGCTQKTFEKYYSPINRWRPNPTDLTKYGIYNENGFWSWMNRINTHPNCCLSFYNWCVESDPNFFIDFGNPKYHKENAEKMWNYLDENFDLFFTNKITNNYITELKVKCQKSWNNGNISMIAIIMSLSYAFGNVSNIEYTYEYGDGGDMGGIDLKFDLETGETKTMQIKSGKFLNMREEFLIEGSPNDLKYKEDYYGYANVDSNTSLTSIIIFDNTKELFKQDKYIVVKEEFIKYQKIQNMPVPEKLNELLILCGRNDIEFTMKKEEEENNVSFNENDKKLTIHFSNFEDKEMESLLDKKINELKELFK
jgi:hypothetical protein